MKRHVIFLKNVQLANILLNTGKCKNEGNWIFSCEDKKEDMEILQNACKEFLKDTDFKNYKLCFANSKNYSDCITV